MFSEIIDKYFHTKGAASTEYTMDNANLGNNSYLVPFAAFDLVGTWDMITFATAIHKAAQCCTFQATNTAFDLRSTGQLRLQVVCNVTSKECLRSPVLGS